MLNTFNFPRYTYSDYKNWKEDWELMDGYPLQLLPSASPKHSKIQARIISQSLNSLDRNRDDCKCTVFTKLDWKINENTVVRPDVMIICGDTKEDFLNFPPVLIIEILSPYNIKTDRVIKFDLYREQGVNFYLMVDCNKENVEVYQLIDNYYKQVDINSFKLDKTCEVTFDFETLWK